MLGGFDIAGMVGLYLGGALYQVPVLIDGVISAVAALLAVKICRLPKRQCWQLMYLRNRPDA